MNDRRAAFPGRETRTTEYNQLDGPYMRKEHAPIQEIHRRYYILLVIGVIAIALFSFYMPVSVQAALHCPRNETSYVYTVYDAPSVGNAVPRREDMTLQPVPNDAVELLVGVRASHMIQRDFTWDDAGGVVLYPAEDTDYALYLSADGAYVYAVGSGKVRYRLNDEDNALYVRLMSEQR